MSLHKRTAVLTAIGIAAIVAGVFLVGRTISINVNTEYAIENLRLQRDEISIEHTNLLQRLKHDWDTQAAQLEAARGEYRVRTATAARAPNITEGRSSNGTEQSKFVQVVVETAIDARDKPRIVVSMLQDEAIRTSFYFNELGQLFLAVRRTKAADSGFDEERWYFVDSEFATYNYRPADDDRPFAPGEQIRSYTKLIPDKPSDIAALRSELQRSLDRTVQP